MIPHAPTSESAEELADDLRNRRKEARDSIAAAQRKQRKYANKYRSGKKFEVGDLVVLKYRRFGPGYQPPKEHQTKIGLSELLFGSLNVYPRIHIARPPCRQPNPWCRLYCPFTKIQR